MGFIPNEVIQQILDRCDIIEIISSSVPLKQAGRNFKGLCPFHHEKTPSFVANPDKQIFHCFGCGAGGNAITFVMQHEHMNFPEAVRILAEKYGITIPESGQRDEQTQLRQQILKLNEVACRFYHTFLLTDRSSATQNVRQYLKRRQITLEDVRIFSLGFASDQWDGLINYLRSNHFSFGLMEKAGLIIPKNHGDGFYDRFRNRIVFPIFDYRAQCVAFGARTLEKDNPVKYINSPETPVYTKGRHLYGFYLAKEAVGRQDFVIVVEGYMDFITPFQAGVKNVVASLGTALTIDQIRLLRRYTKNVVMLFDSDPAGESAMIRSLDLLIEEDMQVKVATLSDGHDPDSFIREYSVEPFEQRIRDSKSVIDFKLSYLKDKHGDRTIEARAKISGEILTTIAKFRNEIIKSEYTKRLAQEFGVDEKAMLAEFNKLKKGISQNNARLPLNQAHPEKSAVSTSIRPVERDLLKLILSDWEYLVPIKEEIDIADIQHPDVRTIFEKVFELHNQGVQLNIGVLMSCYDDQRIHRMISEMSSAVDMQAVDKERIRRDLVQRLKHERLRIERKDLLRQMDLAKKSGNEQKLEELKEEFNQLIKR